MRIAAAVLEADVWCSTRPDLPIRPQPSEQQPAEMQGHARHARRSAEKISKKIQIQNKMCSHGKRKRTCPECLQEQDAGSTGEQLVNNVVCEGVKRRRVYTKRVGIQPYTCEHGKTISICKQGCGGKAICEHGVTHSMCTQGCGGGTWCEHFERRTLCKRCGGGAFCKHGKLRSYCKLGCGGGVFCKHNTRRSHCKLGCGGGSLCKHNKRRGVLSKSGRAATSRRRTHRVDHL